MEDFSHMPEIVPLSPYLLHRLQLGEHVFVCPRHTDFVYGAVDSDTLIEADGFLVCDYCGDRMFEIDENGKEIK